MDLADNGFEIREQSEGLLLVDRKIWGLTYAVRTLSMAGLLCLVLTFLSYTGFERLRIEAPWYVLLGVALVLLLPVPFLLRTKRERQRAAVEEVERTLILDLGSRELRDRMGTVLARVDDLEASLGIDWMTRGWGRLVTLHWPGGKQTILRTLRRNRADDLIERLDEAGISVR